LKSRYAHIIWDWNGTLFDDARLCVEIMDGLLSRRGRPGLTHARYLQLFEIPVRRYYRRLGFDLSKEPFDELAIEFMGAYDAGQLACDLQPCARGILGACRERGLGQSILSAHHQPRLDKIIDHFALREYFTELAGTDNYHGRSKEENGRRLVQVLGLAPESLLLVGDTVHDHEVSRAMGVDCVLIPSGHQPREKLEACGVPVLGSLAEVECLVV